MSAAWSRRRLVASAAVVALVVSGLVTSTVAVVRDRDAGHRSLVVGTLEGDVTVAAPTATVVGASVPQPSTSSSTPVPPAPASGRRGTGGDPLKDADGRPYGTALFFRSDIPVPADLVFVLVVGSDARPGHDPRRANADSVHLLAVDPRTSDGTIVGFPRDSWVEIPGHGRGKLTSALAIGGPRLMAETVRHLTGLPVHHYVITGFAGFSSVVDELGGVDVHVSERMNDRASGARFQPGWHHFNGAQALAFSRNRNDVSYGDFTRSENQGKVVLDALAKLRAEVADDPGLLRWVNVLRRHATVDGSPQRLMELGTLAHRLDPRTIDNVVLPGRIGTAGRASVVYLDARAGAMFADLRPDAVIGTGSPRTTTSTSPTSTSTTTSTPEPTTTTEPDTTTTTARRSTTTLPGTSSTTSPTSTTSTRASTGG